MFINNFVILQVLVLKLTVSLQSKHCTKQSHCQAFSWGYSNYCNICATTKDEVNVCQDHLPDIFSYSAEKKSCLLVEYCKSGRKKNCNGRGRCVTLLTSYYCICNKNAYEKDCSKLMPKIYGLFVPVNGVEASFGTSFFTTTVGNHMLVTVKVKEPGTRLRLKLEMDNRMLLFPDNKCYNRIKCNQKEFKDTIRLPYKLYDEDSPKFFRLQKTFLGYTTNMKLTATNLQVIGKSTKEIVTYTRNFTHFVLYNRSLRCVPLIQLHNCGRLSHVPSFTRGNEITIERSVKFLYNGSKVYYRNETKPQANCLTKLYSGEHNAWTVWNVNHIKIEEQVKYQKFTKLYKNYSPRSNYLYFRAFDLDVGFYEVRTDLNYIQDLSETTNNAFCYFKIRNSPLVPIIEGGLERVVLKSRGLTMKADQSYDPNISLGDRAKRTFKIEWSCTSQNGLFGFCKPKTWSVEKPYVIPSNMLPNMGVFTFILKIWDPKYVKGQNISPRFAYQNVTVSENRGRIIIICVHNCKETVVVDDILFLKVISFHENLEQHQYMWELTDNETGERIQLPTNNNFTSYSVRLKAGTLEQGKKYSVTVHVKDKSFIAAYEFQTEEMPYGGSCTVKPDFGVPGISLFTIECTNPNHHSLLFEYYDKYPTEATNDAVFSGRMLGSTNVGILVDVVLTRGTVMVNVKNRSGQSVEKKFIKVTLSNRTSFTLRQYPDIGTAEFLSETHSSFYDFMEKSYVPDLLQSESEKDSYLHLALSQIQLISLHSVAELKKYTSTLFNILAKTNTIEDCLPSIRLAENSLKSIDKAAKFLLGKLNLKQSLPRMELIEVSSMLLKCISMSHVCKTEDLEMFRERTLDLDHETLLKKISRSVEQSLYWLKGVASDVQYPGNSPVELASEDDRYSLWVLVSDNKFNQSLRQLLVQTKRNSPVAISNSLDLSLKKNLTEKEEIILHVAAFDSNVFWWSGYNMKSSFLQVSLAKQVNKKITGSIKSLEYPLDLEMKFGKNNFSYIKTSSGSILPRAANFSDLDSTVQIHRFYLPAKSSLKILFLYPPTNYSLRVCIALSLRPTFAMFKQSALISDQSPIYQMRSHDTPSEDFYYMGILPGPEVFLNDTVTYSFTAVSTVCQVWTEGSWDSGACQVGSKSSNDLIHCKCNHLSTFSAAFFVPPEDINPFNDIQLFLTVIDNPLVFCVVGVTFFVYFVLSVWAYNRDLRDSKRTVINVLQDNFPADKYPYLIAVYTGCRLLAGTSANVGITIMGASFTSRAHILSSKTHKILKQGSDDWFLIFSPNQLDPIEKIHIWHDNVGFSPGWFCDRIEIYELKTHLKTVFIVEDWIELTPDIFPEACIVAASAQDLLDVKRIFINNFVLGLREDHLLLSVLLRHPRSRCTRVQRVSILTTTGMVAMFCSIMFFHPDFTKRNEDRFSSHLKRREFYISLQTLVISIIISSWVAFTFRRSQKVIIEKKKHRSSLSIRVSLTPRDSVASCISYHSTAPRLDKVRASDISLYSITGVNQLNRGSTLSRLVAKLHPPTLAPIKMKTSKPTAKVRKKWFVAAWTLCFVIIVTSAYLTILYGLKLGPKNSELWLITSILPLVCRVSILNPVTIISISIMLAYFSEQILDTSNYSTQRKEIRVCHKDLNRTIVNQQALFYKLVNGRKHPMYKPIQGPLRDSILARKITIFTWVNFLEFVAFLCFLVVICTLLSQFWSGSFYVNYYLRNLASKAHYGMLDSTSLWKVNSIHRLYDYLQTGFVSAFYNLRWYNRLELKENCQSCYWDSGYSWRMTGLPLIRQARVKSQECNQLYNRTICIPDWSTATIEDGSFKSGWITAQWNDLREKESPWKYFEPKYDRMLTLYRLIGASKTVYDDGGYMKCFADVRQKNLGMLGELERFSWVDSQSRAVFVELTLYNTNINRHSQVTIIVEHLASGVALQLVSVTTVAYCNELFSWFKLTFAVFMILVLFRIGHLINRHGFVNYFTHIENIVLLSIGFLGVASTVTFLFYFYSCLNDELSKIELNSTKDFNLLYLLCLSTVILLSLMSGTVAHRVLTLSLYGNVFRQTYLTLKLSSGLIIICLLMVIVIYVFLCRLSYLWSSYLYKDIEEVVFALASKTVLQDTHLNSSNFKLQIELQYFSLYLVKSFVSLVLIYSFKKARFVKVKDTKRVNFVTFCMNKIKSLLRKK